VIFPYMNIIYWFCSKAHCMGPMSWTHFGRLNNFQFLSISFVRYDTCNTKGVSTYMLSIFSYAFFNGKRPKGSQGLMGKYNPCYGNNLIKFR
jgi:hypothetical protein